MSQSPTSIVNQMTKIQTSKSFSRFPNSTKGACTLIGGLPRQPEPLSSQVADQDGAEGGLHLTMLMAVGNRLNMTTQTRKESQIKLDSHSMPQVKRRNS